MEYILVTGACGGIGEAVTKQLLAQGFGVWAVDMDVERLQNMFGSTQNVKTKVCAFENENAAKDLVKTIVEETGPLRGLVHCAGFDKLSPLYLNKRNDIEALFNIHVYATMDLCKFLAKKGNASENCSIVLISSLSAHEGAKGHTAYAAAKGALEGFLPSAASELADKGIRLNIVTLGVVETKMSMGFVGKMDDSQLTALRNSYPLGLGKPEDAANMICHLLSDKARWVTGQKFVLDGGHSVRGV